jgi:hypothetical protein
MLIMMKRFKEKKSGDNRGSTIIVVLVTMAFLTVLASVLLYLSLVNLQMKKIDKAGKINFYSAEGVMNEIRAGVQEAVSDAIKDAYTGVLVSYNTASEEDQALNFRNLFFSELRTYKIGSTNLFNASGTAYDPAALKAFVAVKPAGTVVVVGGTQAVESVPDGTGSVLSVVLKDISVRYNANGYETSVTSDIRIQAPQLPYTSAISRQTAMPDFAIVAKGALEQQGGGGTVSIFGNVYAGSVVISGSGDTFNVQNAPYFVAAGPVTVSGGALSLNINSSLWARDIKLDAGGNLTAAGDAYIANDLNLYGNSTKAVLSGRYFGYGDSTTEPNNSSSIIINGKNTVLDMSALRVLMLAGHSFVNFNAGVNGYVLMGESVSVRSNQLAYLLPDSCLGQIGGKPVSNPYEYTGAAPSAAELQNAVDLSQQINGKPLSAYGIDSAADHVKYIYKSVGAMNLIYFCFDFPDTARANAYFKDYYDSNGPMIQKYLDIYSDGIILSGNSIKSLSGDAFTFSEGINDSDDEGDTDDTMGTVIEAPGVPSATVDEIGSSFQNLCVTLSRTESAGGYESAYDYFVNHDDLNALTGTAYFPDEENPKAVVSSGDYILDSSAADTVHIVIASGDVTVSGSYSGLILAGGSVTLQSGVVGTASRALVADALQSLLTGDGKQYRFLNPLVLSPMNISTSSLSTSQVWDMNTLVTYENWKKNET